MVVLLPAPIAAASTVVDGVNPATNPDVGTRKPAVIAITDGPGGGLIDHIGDAELSVRPLDGERVGLNPNAVFTYGDVQDPVGNPAFIITNTDTDPHTLIVDFFASGAPPAVEHIRFLLFDGSGRRVGTTSAVSLAAVVPDVAGGDSVYVVVVVDTRGFPSGGTIAGRFTVSVIEP